MVRTRWARRRSGVCVPFTVVVVTHAVPEEWIAAHPVAPFTFVTDGLPSAIERPRSIVRDRGVSVKAGEDGQPVPGARPAR
jgi:hypothetical protein